LPTYYFFIALVPSVVLHEVSHGWVANFFGDPTAKQAHRLTINPLRHLDPFGSVLLPALMLLTGLPAFGYAKPVPVNFSLLRKPRQQSLYVALAGPAVNIGLSAIGYGVCEYAIHVSRNQTMFNVGIALGLVNLVLAVFNLLPIPPLDGSAIIERFVPNRHLGRYYHFRARAMPFFIIAYIVYSLAFRGNLLGTVENWWLNLL